MSLGIFRFRFFFSLLSMEHNPNAPKKSGFNWWVHLDLISIGAQMQAFLCSRIWTPIFFLCVCVPVWVKVYVCVFKVNEKLHGKMILAKITRTLYRVNREAIRLSAVLLIFYAYNVSNSRELYIIMAYQNAAWMLKIDITPLWERHFCRMRTDWL